MKVAERLGDKDNNFNLIRFIAASLVVFSHAGLLIGYISSFEPVLYGVPFFTIGAIGVNVFFVVSGFLVTKSLFERKDVISFGVARALRIFPAFWVMLIVSVFAIGGAMTALPLADYFSSPEVFSYVWNWATLASEQKLFLPGVFDHNIDKIFNRALWTLPLEWRLYEFLALFWILSFFLRSHRRLVASILAPCAAAYCLYETYDFATRGFVIFLEYMNFYMFLAGATIYLFGSRIAVSLKYVLAATIICASCSFNVTALAVAYTLALPLVVITLAYLRFHPILKFNRIGDYSYGIYIYGYPVQQMLAALFPKAPYGLVLISNFSIVFLFAFLSWRLVEKPMLARKETVSLAIKRLFGGFVFQAPRKARAPVYDQISVEVPAASGARGVNRPERVLTLAKAGVNHLALTE
ncbi:MAG: hypothetical protein C5B44_06865 [Acidobacteria bacterium]|nr:MAG: hypothetical protein C5B44_06865 [Acidobacteriota bacterium]